MESLKKLILFALSFLSATNVASAAELPEKKDFSLPAPAHLRIDSLMKRVAFAPKSSQTLGDSADELNYSSDESTSSEVSPLGMPLRSPSILGDFVSVKESSPRRSLAFTPFSGSTVADSVAESLDVLQEISRRASVNECALLDGNESIAGVIFAADKIEENTSSLNDFLKKKVKTLVSNSTLFYAAIASVSASILASIMLSNKAAINAVNSAALQCKKHAEDGLIVLPAPAFLKPFRKEDGKRNPIAPIIAAFVALLVGFSLFLARKKKKNL